MSILSIFGGYFLVWEERKSTLNHFDENGSFLGDFLGARSVRRKFGTTIGVWAGQSPLFVGNQKSAFP
jgi:hypothetical protein